MKIKYNKKNLSISIVIGILCILLTSGIVVQIRTVQNNISISNPDYANNDLRDEVLKSKERYDNAFTELEKVNKELEKYRNKVTENDSSAAEKQEKLNIIANNILKKLGLKRNLTIIDSEDQNTIIKKILKI